MQARPEGGGEARVAVRDEHVGQPHWHVTEHLRDQFARRRHRDGHGLGGGSLEDRDHSHAPTQEVDMHLQKVLAGAGNCTAPGLGLRAPGPRRVDPGTDSAYSRQVVGLDALTRRAFAHTHPDHSERRVWASVR